jgi:hypothetical protein
MKYFFLVKKKSLELVDICKCGHEGGNNRMVVASKGAKMGQLALSMGTANAEKVCFLIQ